MIPECKHHETRGTPDSYKLTRRINAAITAYLQGMQAKTRLKEGGAADGCNLVYFV